MPGVFFHFFYFFFLTRIFLINFRISQIITIIRKRSPAQIPTIIPANLFGCFNRSAIFLLSSTTFRRVSYYSNQKHLLFRLRLCLQTTAYILQLPPMPLIRLAVVIASSSRFFISLPFLSFGSIFNNHMIHP